VFILAVFIKITSTLLYFSNRRSRITTVKKKHRTYASVFSNFRTLLKKTYSSHLATQQTADTSKQTTVSENRIIPTVQINDTFVAIVDLLWEGAVVVWVRALAQSTNQVKLRKKHAWNKPLLLFSAFPRSEYFLLRPVKRFFPCRAVDRRQLLRNRSARTYVHVWLTPLPFRWAVSVISPMIVLKLATTVFASLPFQTLWPHWLNFFRSFKKKIRSMTEQKQDSHYRFLVYGLLK